MSEASPSASGQPFRAADAGELPALQRFLTQVFQLKEIPDNLNSATLRWKCIEPHPFWEGPRGFIRLDQGEITACACLIPLRLRTTQGPVSCGHLIDWAASRRIPGIGVKLYRHLTNLAGSMLGIGGSKDTRSILPRIGAAVHQTSYAWRRVARPWQALRYSPKDWKSPARLGRDLLRAFPPIAKPDSWQARRVERFDESVSPVLPRPSSFQNIVSERSPALLNYWLQCPAARMEGYLLLRRDKLVGYCVLSFLRGECRIADLWVDSDSSQDWQDAFSTAFHAGLAHREIAWVLTMHTVKPAEEALERLRFQRMREDVFLLDPRKTIPAGEPIALTMADYDAFYL